MSDTLIQPLYNVRAGLQAFGIQHNALCTGNDVLLEYNASAEVSDEELRIVDLRNDVQCQSRIEWVRVGIELSSGDFINGHHTRAALVETNCIEDLRLTAALVDAVVRPKSIRQAAAIRFKIGQFIAFLVQQNARLFHEINAVVSGSRIAASELVQDGR